ncbi:hypothetical protein NC797_05785 [Aquibacillus sp. 3ASR75-11]|uniref:Uncharacterized protein n=1 Tax=Terrihalobacillus insolitus TaxID=2950438 RepID=A0A9X3WSG7_9BACI|nr:hypothetical protein [Terrihalobacillus insolitus]MDC3412668.1 hypothetical protein [Terrihalobacillus insolitus]MDC3424018.1 hypothetical protein [Terrihalobacillus insolitus]
MFKVGLLFLSMAAISVWFTVIWLYLGDEKTLQTANHTTVQRSVTNYPNKFNEFTERVETFNSVESDATADYSNNMEITRDWLEEIEGDNIISVDTLIAKLNLD